VDTKLKLVGALQEQDSIKIGRLAFADTSIKTRTIRENYLDIYVTKSTNLYRPIFYLNSKLANNSHSVMRATLADSLGISQTKMDAEGFSISLSINQNNTVSLILNDLPSFTIGNGLEASVQSLAIPTTVDLNPKSSLGGTYSSKFQMRMLQYKVIVGENGLKDKFTFDQTEGSPISTYGAVMTLVENEPAWAASIFTTDLVKRSYYNTTGDKRYELSNHLGNVLSVVSDKKIPTFTGSSLNYFNPDVKSYSDYYPFGMLLPNRHSNTSDYRYVFQYKDHLGNVRLSYSDGNLDGAIDPTSEIIEESNYYPFGLKQKGYNNVITGGNATAQAFKYNGVELNESLGLNLYEMDLRLYDPAIGRFNGIDPVTHHSMGTSVAFDNNPIFWADPSGADAEADDFFASKGGRSGSLAPGDNSPSGAGASSGPRGDSSSSTNSSPPTDYTLGKDGTVYRADPHDGSENDSTDSLTSVKNGNKIENVRKGILEEGQNFKDENSQIPYGGLFQPTLEEIREFIVKLSEDLINKEIAGHGFLNASTGQKTLGFYKYNSNTSEFSESSLYYNNEIVPSLNSFAKFHWHSHLNNGSYINDPSKEYDIPAFNQRTDAGTQSMPSYIFNRNGSFQYDQNGLINN
jgi:RHS repeat-associated protein